MNHSCWPWHFRCYLPFCYWGKSSFKCRKFRRFFNILRLGVRHAFFLATSVSRDCVTSCFVTAFRNGIETRTQTVRSVVNRQVQPHRLALRNLLTSIIFPNSELSRSLPAGPFLILLPKMERMKLKACWSDWWTKSKDSLQSTKIVWPCGDIFISPRRRKLEVDASLFFDAKNSGK